MIKHTDKFNSASKKTENECVGIKRTLEHHDTTNTVPDSKRTDSSLFIEDLASSSGHAIPSSQLLEWNLTWITSTDRLLELELLDNLRRQQIWYRKARDPEYYMSPGNLSLVELQDRAKKIEKLRAEIWDELEDLATKMSGKEKSGNDEKKL